MQSVMAFPTSQSRFNTIIFFRDAILDLGELAMRLDEEERVQMSESENGINS